jgi:hypothetical protein
VPNEELNPTFTCIINSQVSVNQEFKADSANYKNDAALNQIIFKAFSNGYTAFEGKVRKPLVINRPYRIVARYKDLQGPLRDFSAGMSYTIPGNVIGAGFDTGSVTLTYIDTVTKVIKGRFEGGFSIGKPPYAYPAVITNGRFVIKGR